MRTQEVRRKGHKSELGFSVLVSFLIFLASLCIHPPPGLAADASQLVSAADKIAEQFTADLSKGPDVGGRVTFDIPPAGVPPPSLTLFPAPANALARHPEASAPVVDQALELALSRKPRVRVVRLPGPPDADEVTKRLKAAGEIGLFLEPVLLPAPGGVRLAAKARSVLSGQTTATYAEALSLAPTVAQPSPPPTPPSEKLVPPPEWTGKKPAIPPAPTPPDKADGAPPGFVITRKEREPGEIVREGEKGGPIP